MSARKILWGQVLLVGAAVLGFIRAATQRTASQLGFQPQLGHPWFQFFGWPFYQPPAFFWWWFSYDAYAHDIFVEGGFVAGAGGVAAIAVAGARGQADHDLRLCSPPAPAVSKHPTTAN